MPERLELTLPFPPSSNSLFATVGRRRVLSKRGREYVKAVGDAVREHAPRVNFGASRLRLSLTLYPANRRRSDIDNNVKALADSLCKAGLFDDDSQVDFLQVTRGKVMPPGSCVVILEVMG